MAQLLYIAGLIVFVSGTGWLLSSLGVAPTVVNFSALVLLLAGIAVGFTVRMANRA